MVAAAGVAGCASADADDGNGNSVTVDPVATSTAPPLLPSTTIPAAIDAMSSTTTAPAATTRPSPTPTPTSTRDAPDSADEPLDDPRSLEERIADDDFEPSFEIGEPVPLDVDLARFPVDDAGLGGGLADVGDVGSEPSATAEPTGWAGFAASIDRELIRPENTAVSVAVMIGGDLVHESAFGLREPATGDPAEPGDRFRIASISKPITAVVALDLVEDGWIGLDEPVGAIIGAHVGAPSVSSGADRLTLRQLLTHTSGYGKYRSAFFGAGADDCADAARQGLARGGGGGGYTYSNMNYCLAGLLIEALTGQTYEQAVYERLLTPLEISGMRLAPTIDPGPGEAQHRTTPGRNYMETLAGAGGWVASPSDLVTIMNALDPDTPGFKPLDPTTLLAMRTPTGGVAGQRGYGLGLISYGEGRYGHTGTIEATHAMLLDRGDGVIWAITVAGDVPGESTDLERIVDRAFAAAGFVAG